ncbi:hypothetical protein [Herbaspirillum sp. RV1423]|uniref:hypothetical protein n=1 Tax=Herbaspirillum sp. RV1423 TaxID=1443993 RepID=UPI0012DDD60F|nr:hypothetical protein [Herbaspirillum sp. RV1423]
MKSTGCMQTDRGSLRFRFCVDVLSELSLPILAQRHCACSLNAFAPRFSLHPLLRLRNSSSHAFAHVCVRSNVQMACPERAMPQAWLALVGRQAARDAAPPGHRRPVPRGRGKVQGKIKGRGTSARRKPCLHVGWSGTRFEWLCAVISAKTAPALIEWRASPAGLGSAALEFMP